MINEIKHKNDSSEDLYLFMGKPPSCSTALNELTAEQLEEIKLKGRQFKKILALISFKIHERFKTLLAAFRYFDSDH